MRKLRAAVLLSGAGRTLQNLLDRSTTTVADSLPIEIQLAISSRSDAFGLTRARNAGIETAVVESKNYRTAAGKPAWEQMAAALNTIILPRNFDLILFAGFMCYYPLPPELRGRVLNIHPSLLPAFGGQGMFGMRVHQAVKRAGVKISGCTAHLVNDRYDGGAIITQERCEIADTDSVEQIAKKVFALECEVYPRAIKIWGRRWAENPARTG